jgi:hypothetical protein
MSMRCRGACGAIAAALAALALCAGVVVLAGDRPARAAPRRAPAPTLTAGVSTHYPCGEPITLTARLRDSSGHSVKAVKVTFSFRLKSGAVHKYARTNAAGVAAVGIVPGPRDAPEGVRVTVRAAAVCRGVHLVAATWFTPKYT